MRERIITREARDVTVLLKAQKKSNCFSISTVKILLTSGVASSSLLLFFESYLSLSFPDLSSFPTIAEVFIAFVKTKYCKVVNAFAFHFDEVQLYYVLIMFFETKRITRATSKKHTSTFSIALPLKFFKILVITSKTMTPPQLKIVYAIDCKIPIAKLFPVR